jgi:hypothetical protein
MRGCGQWSVLAKHQLPPIRLLGHACLFNMRIFHFSSLLVASFIPAIASASSLAQRRRRIPAMPSSPAAPAVETAARNHRAAVEREVEALAARVRLKAQCAPSMEKRSDLSSERPGKAGDGV